VRPTRDADNPLDDGIAQRPPFMTWRSTQWGKLRLNITMSLDGFVAGPEQSETDPLGIGGMQLHQWLLPLKAFREAYGEQEDVSIGGGANVVQQYLGAGLLDEPLVSVVPILFGRGARLFDNLGEPKPRVRQVQAVEAPGVTHIGTSLRRDRASASSQGAEGDRNPQV
jgi:RibD C-terminal domain